MRQIHFVCLAAASVAVLSTAACGDRVDVPGSTRPPVVRPTPNPDGCNGNTTPRPGSIKIPRPNDC